MAEVHAVFILHGQEPMSAVGGVRGDGDVETWHADEVGVVFKRPVGHRDGRTTGPADGRPRWIQVCAVDFEIGGIGGRVSLLKSPTASVVLHFNTEGRCAPFALEVPVKPVEHLIGPIPA